MQRRNFIKAGMAVGLGSAAVRTIAQQPPVSGGAQASAEDLGLPRAEDPGELRGEMLGERVSAIGLGGKLDREDNTGDLSFLWPGSWLQCAPGPFSTLREREV
jgi:hypothetical protein